MDRVSKNPQISNFMKIRRMGAELFRAEGQTGKHDEADSRFSQFRERASKERSGTNRALVLYAVPFTCICYHSRKAISTSSRLCNMPRWGKYINVKGNNYINIILKIMIIQRNK